MNVNFKSLNTSGNQNGDPHFNNVSLLMHMDGAEGSTNFIDSSPLNKTITRGGLPIISTSIKKFGTGAGSFNGTDQFLNIPNNGFDFGTGDFTIEFWAYKTAPGNAGFVRFFSSGGPNGWGIELGDGVDRTKWSTYQGEILIVPSIPQNEWVHVVFCRHNNTTRIFYNGVQQGSVTDNGNYLSNNGVAILGQGANLYYYPGYLDEFRITKGVARYTGNFTPPTSEFLDTPPRKSLRFGKSNDGKKTLLRPVNLPSTSLPPSYTSLVSFGSNDGVIDENNSTFTPIQNADNLFINGPKEPNDIFVLFFNNTFDWSNINSLGLRLSIDGSNPGTELYIETLNTIYAITRTYNTITIGVNNTSSVIPLTLDLNNNNLSDTIGLIITFIGNLPSGTNITLYDIVSINS